VEANFSLADLSALPFLTAAIGLDRIEGIGAVELAVQASGQSQLDLVSSLDGSASFEFRDGAIRGIDIAKLMRGLSESILTGWQISGQDSTRFTRLAGSFQIDNGIATTGDLSLVGPLVRVTGTGNVDLPRKSLALRVDPRLVASLEGQGGSNEVAGFSVPVVIEGPWARPRIYPEIEGILENPQAALQQLQRLGDGIVGLAGDQSTVGLISRILGGDAGNDSASNSSGGVSGLIGNLFGGNRRSTPAETTTPSTPQAPAAADAAPAEPATLTPPPPPAAEAAPAEPANPLDDPIAAALQQGLAGPGEPEPPADVASLDPGGTPPAETVPEESAVAEAAPNASSDTEQGAPKPKKVPFIRLRATPDGQLVATPGQQAPEGFPTASGSQLATGMTSGPQMPLLEPDGSTATAPTVVPPLPRPKPKPETAAVNPDQTPMPLATPEPAAATPPAEASAEAQAEPPQDQPEATAGETAPDQLLLPQTTDDVLRDLFGQ